MSRAAKVFAAAGFLTTTAAAAAVALSPVLRDEARRLSRLARPLGPAQGSEPVPPPLPPGRVVELPGRGEAFYRDTGGQDRPVVILLHGWTLTADLNWFACYDLLAQRYRVIALDHRGHGRGLRSRAPFTLEACADDAAALLAVLGVGRAVAVGFSMGGPVAMLLHDRHPGLVSGLVLAGSALDWRDGARDRMLWRGMSVFEVAIRNGTGDGLVRRVLRESTEERPELVPYLDWATGEFGRSHPPDLAGAGRALSSYDGRRLAGGVRGPSAVVLTTRDTLVQPDKQRKLAEALRAPVFEVEGDHSAFFARSGDFASAIRAAIDSVVP